MNNKQMLAEIGLNREVVTNLKRGQMPSADKLILIANYLEVSAEYLIGLTDNPTPPKKNEEMTAEERLAAEVFKMSPKKQKQLEEYAKFLKMQEELAQELDANSLKPQPE